MAIGWLYLYSRHRKTKRQLREAHESLDYDDEICDSCGYPRYKHADDDEESCPSYPDS